MKLHGSLILMVFACAIGHSGEALAQVQDDARLWTGFTGKVELLRSLRLDVSQELRLDDTFAGYDKTFTEVGAKLRVKKFLELAAAYRFIVLSGETQHRGQADVELRYGKDPWEVAYRLRLQSTSRVDGTRSYVRNKVKGRVELGKRLEPFVASEVFYSTTRSEFRQVRFQVGTSYELSKRLDLEGFYMYRYEFNVALPERNHIIGLGVSYLFRDVKKKKKKKKKKKNKNKEDDEDDEDE